jgi:hypothetical protein
MALISDGLLLAATLAAIFYCFFVSRRLGGLKKQSADLTVKLAELDETISHVRVAISEGRELAVVENDRLKEMLEQAERLRSDLRKATASLEKSLSKDAENRELDRDQDPVSRIKRLQRRQDKRSA